VSVRLPVVDKYGVASPDIPCAEMVPLCKAICCGLVVHLSEQDVAEGVVARDPDRPELLASAGERCVHLDAGGCTVYAHRPAPCRTFDCRNDRRIWLDYERRIPNPNVERLALAAANWRNSAK
jgi:Fe-S-cluster containining protein